MHGKKEQHQNLTFAGQAQIDIVACSCGACRSHRGQHNREAIHSVQQEHHNTYPVSCESSGRACVRNKARFLLGKPRRRGLAMNGADWKFATRATRDRPISMWLKLKS